mmetsp:Transcript_32301/g.77181  ORF Transcript_32301/g.77181 Transcript_32301/m.77181 type:complete len:221 (+) Transcript_32301:1608-2270(+)
MPPPVRFLLPVVGRGASPPALVRGRQAACLHRLLRVAILAVGCAAWTGNRHSSSGCNVLGLRQPLDVLQVEGCGRNAGVVPVELPLLRPVTRQPASSFSIGRAFFELRQRHGPCGQVQGGDASVQKLLAIHRRLRGFAELHLPAHGCEDLRQRGIQVAAELRHCHRPPEAVEILLSSSPEVPQGLIRGILRRHAHGQQLRGLAARQPLLAQRVQSHRDQH